MQRDLQHAALAGRHHLGHTLDGSARAAALDEPQAAGLFRHEHAAVGEERHRPRRIDARHHVLDPEAMAAGLVDAVAGRGRVDPLEGRGAAALPDEDHQGADLRVGERALPRGHAGVGVSLPYDAREVGIAAAVQPFVVEQR
jgi:hypothetical protein